MRCIGTMAATNLRAKTKHYVGDYTDYIPFPFQKLTNVVGGDQNIGMVETDILGFTGFSFPGPAPPNKGADYIIAATFSVIKQGGAGTVTLALYMGANGDLNDTTVQSWIDEIPNGEERTISVCYLGPDIGEKFGFTADCNAGTVDIKGVGNPTYNLSQGYCIQVSPRTVA